MMIMKLDEEEIATILAALRFYQANPGRLRDIATDGDTFAPMDDAGIDDLCERINCGGG